MSNTRNQAKVQHDVTAAVKATSTILGLGIHAVDGYRLAWQKFSSVIHKIAPGVPQPGKDVPFPPGPVLVGPLGRAGIKQGLTGPAGTVPPRSSLSYQLSLLQEKLAKAELTSGLKDDRAVLVRTAALLKQKISKTKELGARIQLEQSLGSVEQQIAQIDAKGAADVKAAREKQIAAEKRKAAKEKEQHDKLVALARKQAEAVKTATANMRQAFQTALGNVQGVIGDLFQGPTLAGETQAQHLAAAGVPGTTAKELTGDVVAQTAQARRFYNDLRKLKKLGASKGLLSTLTAQGTSAIPQIETLLKSPGQARAFIKAYGQQERFATKIAAMNVTANRVVIAAKSQQPMVIYLTLDGKVVSKTVTTHQQRRRRNAAAGVRGTGQEIGAWAFQ